jgi:cytochrome c biogenesis protein
MKSKRPFSSLVSNIYSKKMAIGTLLILACTLIGLSFSEGFFHAIASAKILSWIMVCLAAILSLSMLSAVCLILFSRKRSIEGFALVLLHVGIPVMIAGYFMSFLGINGEMAILQGSASDTVKLKSGKQASLDFSVHCDNFQVRFNNDGSPSEYISSLSFMKDRGIKKRTELRVNHPAEYGGYGFYQSGYSCEDTAIIKYADDRNIIWAAAKKGDLIKMDTGAMARVDLIAEDLMGAGPAVQLIVNNRGKTSTLWLLKNLKWLVAGNARFLDIHPEFNPSAVRPYVFMLEDLNSECSTILAVRKDPGMMVMASGAAIFSVGLIIFVYAGLNRKGRDHG